MIDEQNPEAAARIRNGQACLFELFEPLYNATSLEIPELVAYSVWLVNRSIELGGKIWRDPDHADVLFTLGNFAATPVVLFESYANQTRAALTPIARRIAARVLPRCIRENLTAQAEFTPAEQIQLETRCAHYRTLIASQSSGSTAPSVTDSLGNNENATEFSRFQAWARDAHGHEGSVAYTETLAAHAQSGEFPEEFYQEAMPERDAVAECPVAAR